MPYSENSGEKSQALFPGVVQMSFNTTITRIPLFGICTPNTREGNPFLEWSA